MRRVVLVAVYCSALLSCGGGGGTSSATAPSTDPLNPTQLIVEQPPTNGQLPSALLPPT